MKQSELQDYLRDQAEKALQDFPEQLPEGLVVYNGEDRVYFSGGLQKAFNKASYDALRAQDTEHGQSSYAVANHPALSPFIAYHTADIAHYTDTLPLKDVVSFIFNHELAHIILGPVNGDNVRHLVSETASDVFGFLRAVQQGADAEQLYGFMVDQRNFGVAFHGNADYLTTYGLHEARKWLQEMGGIDDLAPLDIAWLAIEIAEKHTPAGRDMKVVRKVFDALFTDSEKLLSDVQSLLPWAVKTEAPQAVRDLVHYALDGLGSGVMYDAQGVNIVDAHPGLRDVLNAYEAMKPAAGVVAPPDGQPSALSSSGMAVKRSATKP